MNRVLVTGASGFVGSHCLDPLLRQGFEVHAISRRPAPTGPWQWHQADLLDPRVPERVIRQVEPTHLLHTAWNLTPGEYPRSLDNLRWVEASLTLYRAFHASGGKRLVATGSCFEYDWSAPVLSEADTPLRATTAYGESKIALFHLSEVFAKASGISVAWARLFYLFGPREHPSRLASSVTRALLAGSEALVSHGRQRRDYLYITDAAEALAALLASDLTGPVNVGAGRAIAVRELVEEIAHAIGRRDLVMFGAIAVAESEPAELVADVTRVRKELGWEPRISLPAGVAKTVEWWRAQATTS